MLAGAEGLIAVDWNLGRGTLCLRANLSERTADDAPKAPGAVLWVENGAEAESGRLAPLSLVWTLEPAKGQGR